jgi:trigger factor
MKVTQEVLPECQVGLAIEVPPEMSQKTHDQVLRKLMRTVNIPGFRKGKVPQRIFIQRIGMTQFKAAVLEELVQDAIDLAIKQEAVEALGNYQLKTSFEDLVSQYEPGKVLNIVAAVDVPPRVTLKQYQGLTIQAEEIKPDPDRVEDTLAQYQNNKATLVPVEDRPAQMGDVVVVDFVGKVQNEDGEVEEFPGGSATDFQVELDEGRFIPGFVEGIAGMILDQVKELEVTFPEDYPQEDLAGQPAIFSITLKEIKEKELPDLDDDFAQEISEFETIEELRNSLTERYQEEADQQTQSNKDTALLDELVTHLEAEIPNTLIQKEVDFMLTQTVMQLSRQGLDVNKLLTREVVENMRERTRPEAIDRLQRTLALGEVAKQVEIAVDDESLKAKIDETMEQVDDPTQIDPDRLQEVLHEELLQEKVLAWLEENNTIELVPEGTLAPAEEVSELTEATPEDDGETTAVDEAVAEPSTEMESAAATEDEVVAEAKSDSKKKAKKSTAKASEKSSEEA